MLASKWENDFRREAIEVSRELMRMPRKLSTDSDANPTALPTLLVSREIWVSLILRCGVPPRF